MRTSSERNISVNAAMPDSRLGGIAVKEMPLSLNGDTFNALKLDFDTVLRDTISNMELKGADVAELSVKLKIHLERDRVNDFEAAYEGALRRICFRTNKDNL